MKRSLGVVLIGGLAASGAALALGALGLRLAQESQDPDTGPTAATLNEAFAAWSFGLLGLMLVGVAASALVWPVWPTSVGTASVFLGYVFTWILHALLFGPSDLETREEIVIGLFFAPVAAVAGVVAGAVGLGMGGWIRRHDSSSSSLV